MPFYAPTTPLSFPVDRFPKLGGRAATCGKTGAKKAGRDGLVPLRSEIRWALFVVLYQVSAHLYAVVGVPEPQDQLTI